MNKGIRRKKGPDPQPRAGFRGHVDRPQPSAVVGNGDHEPSENRHSLMLTRVNRWYHRAMFGRFTDGAIADFSNWGYWQRDTRTYLQACENLMERLLSFIPERSGTILDVVRILSKTWQTIAGYLRKSDLPASRSSTRHRNAGCAFTTSLLDVPECASAIGKSEHRVFSASSGDITASYARFASMSWRAQVEKHVPDRFGGDKGGAPFSPT
jgi:hypothetical protein